MKFRLALLASVVLALAVPVGASAHPVERQHDGADAREHDDVADPAAGRRRRQLRHDPQHAAHGLLGASRRPERLRAVQLGHRVLGRPRVSGHVVGLPDHRHRRPAQPEGADRLPRLRALRRGQGDMVVWGSILVRTWDANNVNPPAPAPARTCDGDAVRPARPVVRRDRRLRGPARVRRQRPRQPGPRRVASTCTCGSHTATGVPDLRNRRLLVYSTPSSAACEGIDIVEVPLSRPQESEFLRFEFAGSRRGRGEQLRVP